MVQARRQVGEREVDVVRVVRARQRHDDDVQEQDDEGDHRDDCRLVVGEAAKCVAPEARLPDRRAGGVGVSGRLALEDVLSDLHLFRVDDHQLRASRVLGSRIPYMMSTNMFATMIRIDSSTVIPITVE